MLYKLSISFIIQICFFAPYITQAGYYFKNDSPETKFVTMYDQDKILVVENFEIKPFQALIFSCKYLKKHEIEELMISQSDKSNTPQSLFINIPIICPNYYYHFYDLNGKLLFRENSKTAVPSFKENENLGKCLFIKRGFFQEGLFLRNIEKESTFLLTLNSSSKNIFDKVIFSSNGELYISQEEWEEIMRHEPSLQIMSNFRSNETGNKISCNQPLPSPIRVFDAQIIYLLSMGLQSFAYRHGMNQFDQATKEKLKHLAPYKKYLKKTLLRSPRISTPQRLHSLLQKKFQKQQHCIIKNTAKETYEISIKDQNNDFLIRSIFLVPKQKIHLSSSYLSQQSVESLIIIAHNLDEKKHDNQSRLNLSARSDKAMCQKYSIFGDLLCTLDSEKFYKKSYNYAQSFKICRGFVNYGFWLRNIDTKELTVTIEDDHNRMILDRYALPANGEVFFSPEYSEQTNVDHFEVTLHEDDGNMSIPINLPHYCFDNQTVYNVAAGLSMFTTSYPNNQFNELSLKYKPLKKLFARYLLNKNNFFSQKEHTPHYIPLKDLVLTNLVHKEATIFDEITKPSTVIQKKLNEIFVDVLNKKAYYFKSETIRSELIPLKNIHLFSIPEANNIGTSPSIPLNEIFAKCLTRSKRFEKEKNDDEFLAKFTPLNKLFIDFLLKHTNFYSRRTDKPLIIKNHGYSLRNIGTKDLTITIKDDHNRPLLNSYTLPSNGEIYFSPKYTKQNKIEYIMVTLHKDEKNVENDVIKPPLYSLNSQTVYNLALGLKMFSTKYQINEDGEISSRPMQLEEGLEEYLDNTVFFEKRVDEPFTIKEGPKINASEELFGPISPSSKLGLSEST